MADPIPNQGQAPVDVTSPVGQVRLLLGDTDPTNVSYGQGSYLWHSDNELTGLVTLYGGNVFRTAVRILRNIAGSESLKLKKWTSAQLAVDGPAVTTALLALADSIEADDRYGVSIDAAEYVRVAATGGRDPFARRAKTQDEEMWLFRTGYYAGVYPDYYGVRDFLEDVGGEEPFDGLGAGDEAFDGVGVIEQKNEETSGLC